MQKYPGDSIDKTPALEKKYVSHTNNFQVHTGADILSHVTFDWRFSLPLCNVYMPHTF
jgi:hypothetical protein